MKAILVVLLAALGWAQVPVTSQTPKYDAKHPPRFEDFPVAEKWTPPAAPVQFTTPSEKMFLTNLTNASKEPPNFAGHFRFVMWGCGSNCGAGAVVDLVTGLVYPPPLGARGDGWSRWMMSSGFFEGSGVDFKVDSRLVVVKASSSIFKASVPDVYYFVSEGDRFRQLLFVSGKQPSNAKPTTSITIVR